MDEEKRQRAIQAGRNLMDAYNAQSHLGAVMGSSQDDGTYAFIIDGGHLPCKITVEALDH